MKRHLIAITACVVIPVSVAMVTASSNQAAGKTEPVAQKKEKPKVARFMRAKLSASQHVLEGLVTEDFAQIEKGAKKMIVMSNAADWQVIRGPVYAQYSTEFRRAATQLARMAKAKKIDGTALSYMHLTLTCVNCHKYVKTVKIANGQPVPRGLQHVSLPAMNRK